MGVAAFPWASLPRVSAREPEVTTALRRAFAGATPQTIGRAIHALIGHAATIDARRRALVPVARVDLGARGTTIVLEGDGRVVAIEVEAELALALVGALAGGRSLPKIAKGRKVSAEIAGALAGVVQHVARACGAESLAVVGMDASTGDVRARLGLEDALAIDAKVSLGALRSIVRVVATAAAGTTIESTQGAPKEVLAAMGETPLVASIVLGSGVARRVDAVLRLGDVLVVDDLSRTRCVIVPVDGSSGVEGALVDRMRVRITARRAALAAEPAPDEEDSGAKTAEEQVSEPTDSTGETMEMALGEDAPLADALAEAPIVVRVEAGTVTLPARAWASMGAGDVVALDRRTGESVVVRVGGRVVARGELVDVDGTLGVRILERIV